MSDIPSTGPDYQNLVELQPKVQEERKLDSFPKLSFPVGTLVIETGGRIDYVLTAGGLQQEKNDLKEEINLEIKQKEVLIKIYQSLGENNPELKQAIENQTIKIFEVPNRDLVALSVDGKNIDYLYNSKGEIYFNFIDIKKSEIKDWFYIAGRKLGFDVSYNITTGEIEFKNKDNNSPVLSLNEKAIINTKIADLLKDTGKRIIDAIDTLEEKERDH